MKKAKHTPSRRRKPLSRIAQRRRPTTPAPEPAPPPAPAGAVKAGPCSWTPHRRPHQRVRLYVHGGVAGLMTMDFSDHEGPSYPGFGGWYDELKRRLRSGQILIAVGYEEGVMVAHLAPHGTHPRPYVNPALRDA